MNTVLKNAFLCLSAFVLIPGFLAPRTYAEEFANSNDFRNLREGFAIPSEGYCDQPYIVVTQKGHWLCVLTTGAGREGQVGQHLVSTISEDQGKTWSAPVDIERADGPEASWGMPLLVPSGRIYVFYTYNKENLREVIADKDAPDSGFTKRVDTLGAYMFKYSDDQGRSWSEKRYEIPMRLMKCDRENPYQGKVLFFWGVGKPILHNGTMYLGFSKVGRFGKGFLARSEACFLKSDNIATETDPEKIRWDTLPGGEEGLKAPAGPIAEESNLAALSDGSLFATYRTVDGFPCHAYSRDGGTTWTPSDYMTYGPDGPKVKHPRAANFVWRCSNGMFLYWFHNHGGSTDWLDPNPSPYAHRNPAWLMAGREEDSAAGKIIQWSQPEMVLYDDDPLIRFSYPCLVEDAGRFFLTETQKSVGRIHPIPIDFLNALFQQHETKTIARNGLILERQNPEGIGGAIEMPALPLLTAPDRAQKDYRSQSLRNGFSLDLWFQCDSLKPGQILLDNRTRSGIGFVLETNNQNSLQFRMYDGRTNALAEANPNLLKPRTLHHVAVIIDGGSRIISFVVDGRLCDGGEYRPFGWSRFSPDFCSARGDGSLKIAPNFYGKIYSLRLYNRHLLTSEAVGNFNAGFNP